MQKLRNTVLSVETVTRLHNDNQRFGQDSRHALINEFTLVRMQVPLTRVLAPCLLLANVVRQKLNNFGPSFVVQGVTRDNLALPSRGERALRPPGTGKECRNGECAAMTNVQCDCTPPPRFVCLGTPLATCALPSSGVFYAAVERHSRGGYNTPPMLVCTAVATLERRETQELASKAAHALPMPIPIRLQRAGRAWKVCRSSASMRSVIVQAQHRDHHRHRTLPPCRP